MVVASWFFGSRFGFGMSNVEFRFSRVAKSKGCFKVLCRVQQSVVHIIEGNVLKSFPLAKHLSHKTLTPAHDTCKSKDA